MGTIDVGKRGERWQKALLEVKFKDLCSEKVALHNPQYSC